MMIMTPIEGPEVEVREVEEGQFIGDMFSDRHPDPLLQFVSQFYGLNPPPGDLCLMSFTDAFKLFFDGELVGKLCASRKPPGVMDFISS